MSRVRLLAGVLLVAFALGLMVTTSTAYAQEQPIVIEGQVTNATPDGSGVENVPVTLHLESLETHSHVETRTDQQGRFRIENISFDPTVIYGVSVRHQGGIYGVDLDLSNGSPPPLELTIFDATSEEGVLNAISASVLYAWADKDTQMVSALEIINLVNRSDKAYVPNPDVPMSMVRFGLPPNAERLSVEANLPGADFIQVDRGFALFASIPPGEHEISFTYQFPYSGSRARFNKSLIYGAGSFRAMAPFDVMDLSSDQLGQPSSVTIGEREWQVLEADGIPPGSQISIALGGLPQRSLIQQVKNSLSSIHFEYAAPITLVMLMLGLVAFALWRRRREEVPAILPLESSEESVASQERLVIRQMLKDLEQGFRTGEVSEDDYRRRRRVLNSRLVSLPRG